MNIKAERIEQLIQVVNRNLLLIYSGQRDGMVPIDTHRLQRVDAAVFEGDKFAFEMVHFVKSTSRNEDDASITGLWDRDFSKGLETLLVECAVVGDDIERDCFVSRIYCWFTEKLTERRDLPRAIMGRSEMKDLRNSLNAMDVDVSHTLKGLESYKEPASTTAALEEKPPAERDPPEAPAIRIPQQSAAEKKAKLGNRQLPVYVKHSYPNLFKEQASNKYENFLPKVPGAEDNYGMMYHEPTTEGEKQMHELWLARRQQEAFNWKSEQHMNLVMDRLALHKSRLESDSLRRQESNSFLQNSKHGGSGGQHRPLSAEEINNNRFSGSFRPNGSGKNMLKTYALKSVTTGTGPEDYSPEASPEKPTEKTNTIKIKLKGAAQTIDADVPKPAREMFGKPERIEKEIKHVPMRYKLEVPGNFMATYNSNAQYMQLSDSDDDDKPERELKGTVGKGTQGGKKGGKKAESGGKGGAVVVKFKRDKPTVRERPVSATMFHKVSTNDSELKVHYRHTNYRRMPLTEKQEEWLEEKESEREKKYNEKAALLVEAATASKDKGKDKGGKDDKGKGKGKGKVEEAPVVKLCRYKSASDFMATTFPQFENDEDGDTQGPMRMMQLVECARVMGALEDYGEESAATLDVVRKALVIPQDKPEAISLENMRENQTEGLMLNPAPKEYWRQVPAVKGKKGGGKKGKKK